MNDPTKLIINVRVTGDRALNDTQGMLTTSVSDQQVELEVVYDDGSLQDELDQKYGSGIVVVQSALQPVEH